MAAQAIQFVGIHFGYQTQFDYWSYETDVPDHICVTIMTDNYDFEVPDGYLYSNLNKHYLKDSKVWVYKFEFNY